MLSLFSVSNVRINTIIYLLLTSHVLYTLQNIESAPSTGYTTNVEPLQTLLIFVRNSVQNQRMTLVGWVSLLSRTFDLPTISVPSNVPYSPSWWKARIHSINAVFPLWKLHLFLTRAHHNLLISLLNHPAMVHNLFTCMYFIFCFVLTLSFIRPSFRSTWLELPRSRSLHDITLFNVLRAASMRKLSLWNRRTIFFACLSAPLLNSSLLINSQSKPVDPLSLRRISSHL